MKFNVFNGFRHCSSGDKMFFIYVVISEDYALKGFVTILVKAPYSI